MRRRLLGCVVLALGAVVATPAAPAQAIAPCAEGYQCQTYFYSGPDRHTEVGYWSTDCDGFRYQEGNWTPWSFTDTVRCGGFPI